MKNLSQRKILSIFIFIFSIVGLFDSIYLTIEHFKNTIPPCTLGAFADCGTVLSSEYSEFFGIPLSLFGVVHYFLIYLYSILIFTKNNEKAKWFLAFQSIIGFVFSVYLVYLQLVILNSICIYCMLSAITSTLIFIVALKGFSIYLKRFIYFSIELAYTSILKPIFFKFDAEKVHESITLLGRNIGNNRLVTSSLSRVFVVSSSFLEQKLNNIEYKNPVGLAAGFDYNADLSQTLYSMGFGFQTIGTITNLPYAGNTPPRLARLPKSKSLLVNKGFKNPGHTAVINKLTGQNFRIPLGISIGRTNSSDLTFIESINDIVNTFENFEKSKINNSYYELNISCPNLKGNIEFYSKKNLTALLDEVNNLKIKKPIYIKMPIEKTNQETIEMLEVISNKNMAGVILGNLQKDRTNKFINSSELKNCGAGNFSGRPTFERSNELIELAYKNFSHLTIIGCGGIFNAKDAYEKLVRGASLVQLITGLVYQGPQLVAQINFDLLQLLKDKGIKNISQVVGSGIKK